MHQDPSQAFDVQEDVGERRERRTGTLLDPRDIGRYGLVCSISLGYWAVRSIGEHLGSVPSQRAQEAGIRECS